VLASQSPQRRALLASAGYDFVVMTPHATAECGVCSRESPQEMVARLAMQKARDVAQRLTQGLVIGCDTVAECCGQILGKPVDRAHAGQMLQLLQGNEHRVLSGLCLWRRPDDRIYGEVVTTTLVMDRLSRHQLGEYLDSERWQGKAGAFGYQEGWDWVHVVTGSESNVIGLPLEHLGLLLTQVEAEGGWKPPDECSIP
jgi:septum formation protein